MRLASTQQESSWQVAFGRVVEGSAIEQQLQVTRPEDVSLSDVLLSEDVYRALRVVPVVGSGTDSILFNFNAMQPDQPYPFRFLDHWMVGITDGDGGVAVYYIPNPDAS